MANEEHVKMLKQGVEEWNNWRINNPAVRPILGEAILRETNLCGANLRGAYLKEADLRNTNLTKANLTGADLGGATLRGADLRWAILSSADLLRTNLIEANLGGTVLYAAHLVEALLSGADLRGADLRGADLSGATLREAVLAEADFSNVRIGYTILANVDLRALKGIETIKHFGPSTIGIDTIYRSKGKIPVEFLRGAGVPDNFIEYMGSLTGTAFEFYSCFISYSSKDEEFANRLFADLQREDVRCWFAPHHVQAGKKLHEQIDVAIRLHEKLLLILSPDSINSEWVKTEIAKARKRESQEKKRVLFPVRLNISYEQLQEWECFDADCGKDSACEIREYYIPDFTKWKNHDQYQEEFKKLVRDLKK